MFMMTSPHGPNDKYNLHDYVNLVGSALTT